MESALRSLVKSAAPDLGDVECTLMSGPPARTLIRYAREQNLDVLVLARTSRMTGLTDILGSVPRRVIRELPCTVVITPWRQASA